MSTSPLRRISKSWKVRYRHYLVDESGRPRYSSITRNNFRNPGCRKRHITRYSPYNFNATGSCRTSGPITRLYQTFHDLLMRPPTLRLPNSESVSLCRILPLHYDIFLSLRVLRPSIVFPGHVVHTNPIVVCRMHGRVQMDEWPPLPCD
jgi:hypothetical protein